MAAEVGMKSGPPSLGERAGGDGRPGGGAARAHLSPLTDSSNKVPPEPTSRSQGSLILPAEPAKPLPGPKPRLTPKPFTVDRPSAIRPILAPKPSAKSEARPAPANTSKPSLGGVTGPSAKPSPNTPKPISTTPNTTPEVPTGSPSFKPSPTPKPDQSPGSAAPCTPPASVQPQTVTVIGTADTPGAGQGLRGCQSAEWAGRTRAEAEPEEGGRARRAGSSITRAKSMGFLNRAESRGAEDRQQEGQNRAPGPDTPSQLRSRAKPSKPRPVSAMYPSSSNQPDASPTKDPGTRPWVAARRPLSSDLTAKFESIGLSLHSKAGRAVHSKENKPDSAKEEEEEEEEEEENAPAPAWRRERVLERGAEGVSPRDLERETAAPETKPVPEEAEPGEEGKEETLPPTGGSIKRRISQLLDSSSSPSSGGGVNTQGSAPPLADVEPTVGVKQRIKELTATDTPPGRAEPQRRSIKPRPLPADLTRRFARENPAPSGNEATRSRSESDSDAHRKVDDLPPSPLGDPERGWKGEEGTVAEGGAHEPCALAAPPAAATPRRREEEDEEKVTEGRRESGNGGAPSPNCPSSPGVLTVRASLFDNVVERHTVGEARPLAEGGRGGEHAQRSQSVRYGVPAQDGARQRGILATASFRETPTFSTAVVPGPLAALTKVEHVYDAVGAVGERRAVSEELPAAQHEDRALTLRSRRASSGEPATPPAQGSRCLRVGALQKWRTDAPLQAGGVQSSPDSPGAEWHSRRAPGVPAELEQKEGELEKEREGELERERQRQLEQERQRQLEQERERQRQLEQERQRQLEQEREGQRQLEQERERQRQLEQERQRQLEQERQRQLEQERERQRQLEQELERQKQLEIAQERQRQLELEQERQRQLEQERERWRQLELEQERQKQLEIAQERQRQLEQERERQRQLELEQERQRQLEQERRRQLELERERQKQLEIAQERQRQLELEQERQLEQALERQRQLELERERQKQLELEQERQRQLEQERRRQLELERERQKQLEIAQERQRQLEQERQRQLEQERQRQLEQERQKQLEQELERQRQLEIAQERQRQLEQERQRQLEQERQKQLEQEIERQRQLEIAQERQRQLELEQERQLEQALERQRQLELERERQKQLEIAQERQRQLEQERQKQLEQELERQRQLEIAQERQRQLEQERQKQLEQELERQRQLEIAQERQRQLEQERQRQLEQELERQRQLEIAQERQRQLEQERQRQLELERERQRQLEQELERQRQLEIAQERQRQLEQERQRQRQLELERERQRELEWERQRQLELEWERQKELQKERQGNPTITTTIEQGKRGEGEPRAMFFALTGQTKDSPPEVPKSVTSSAGIEVLYDDFSVKQRQWSIPRFSLPRSPSLEAAFGKAEETVQDQAHALRQQEEEESEGPGRAMLKPSVLDLNSPTIGEQKDRSPRWETPAPKAGESYRLPVLDVDSFRGSSEGGPQLLASSRRICNPESPRHQPIQEVLPVADIQKPGGHQHQEEGSHKPGTYSMDLDPKTAKRHILGASSAPQEALITENPPQQSGITEPISSPSQKAFWETGGKEGSGSRGRGAEELPDHWGTAPWPSVLDQKQNQNLAQFPEPLSQSSAASVPQDWKKGADQRGSSRLPPLQPESQRQGDTLDSWRLHQRPLAGGEPSAERHTQPHRRDSARAKPGSVSWKPAPPESPLEGPLARARSRSRHTEEQLKQCVSRAPEEGKDTDTLVPETDSQYGTWDTGLRTEDSLTPASPTAESSLSASLRRHTPSSPLDLATPSDPDVTDGLSLSLSTPGEQEELSFPEPAASLLDCSAMKARAQLSRKSRRSLPSRPARRCPLPAGAERLGPLPEDWLYRDSTEHKPDPPQEDSDTEDPANAARRVERSPAPQPQRVPLFPGMDPSALKAQLRKRTDSDSQADTPSPTQLSRSPKSPFVPGTRVRPPSGRKENGSEESSPQWLKELKSKKRLSQYDNDA